ncbi:MAG: ribbon-helix-helix protein, CopG family [Christensenellaceae bacterium]|nr:ribbon-helix-helix protein, CopG family [Christensenellaceae bacterium]
MSVFSPQKPDKEVISIRLPAELLRTIDENAARVDISRNEFINQCIVFAIEHIEKD